MGQARAAIQEPDDALGQEVSEYAATGNQQGATYRLCQVDAIAQVDSFQAALAAAILARDVVAMRISAHSRSAVRIRQGDDAGIRDAGTLDEANSFELRKSGKSGNRVIGQIVATPKINIANPVARGDEPLHAIVGDLTAVAHVKKVQVPPKARNGIDGSIRQVATFLQYKISESRGNLDDLLDRAVGDSCGVAQVENTEMIIRPIRRERKKSGVVYQVATTKAKFTQSVAFGEERSNWFVADVPALLEIDF